MDVRLFCVVQFFCLATLARAGGSNNTLLGPPLVMCGPDTIEIQATSSENFNGVVFIKNWRRTDGCFKTYANENKTVHPRHGVSLSELSQCGMEMKRNRDTKELEVFGVFVFSFHPNFVTFGDRAFAVHCIFRQTTYTVGTGFDFISDMATRDTFSATAAMPMPLLTIIPGRIPDPNLKPASTVRVGQPLMFVWHLPADSGVYGIRVRDCTAETLRGKRVRILEDGCSLDDAAVSDVTYSDDRNKAFADAMAFKFPDAEDLWFKCTVSTCIKYKDDPNDADSCRIAPKCNTRQRRDLRDPRTQQNIEASVDDIVLGHKLMILDSFNQHPQARHIKDHPADRNITRVLRPSPQRVQRRKWQLCLRKPVFALITSVLLLVYMLTFVAAAVAVVLILNRRPVKNDTPDSTIDRQNDIQRLWARH